MSSSLFSSSNFQSSPIAPSSPLRNRRSFNSILEQIGTLGVHEKQKLESQSFWKLFQNEWNSGCLKPIALWIIWIFLVNVGYCIGWGVLTETSFSSYYFSIVYIFVGASTVSGWLAYLIDTTLNSSDSWHLRLQRETALRNYLMQKSYLEQFMVYIQQNTFKLYIIILWFAFIFFGAVWSCGVIGWGPIEGLYFSFTSLSTGGNHGIPIDSPDYVFFTVGLFAAFGIPVMGMAMGTIAASIASTNQNKKTIETIYAKVSVLEEAVFRELQFHCHDGNLSRNEFMILILLRLGAIDTDLIEKIYRRFDELDVAKMGEISFRDLLEMHRRRSSATMNPILLDTTQSVTQ